MQDTYKHQGQRRKLIEGLRLKGIQDDAVLQAMETLPRHFFMEKGFEQWAYEDRPFSIGAGQTISQPYTVAFQTSLLQVSKRQKVLEVGTGSGYQASVLGVMGVRVYTIERHESLYMKASAVIKSLNLGNIRCYWKDGYKGLPEYAPFDRILVTAGAPQVPQALLDQLAIGGILVIPVGTDGQTMLRITRTSQTEYQEESFGRFQFVPFLDGKE